jgi:anti-sigma factor RsiW
VSEVNEKVCSHSQEISAYLDGELASSAEAVFERHLAECSLCAAKMNEQKRLLHALDFAFEEKSFELPKDFAKTVAVRAEADLSGLKTSEERRRALLITVGLFLLGALVGFVGKRSGILPAIVERFLTQTYIVAEVLARFAYDVCVGAVVVLRAFGRQFISDSTVSGFFLVVVLLIAFAILSRLLLKFHRA